MIYAMHQIKIACLLRHGRGSAWHQRLLRRICSEQLLLASSTTEGQGGGDVRKSALRSSNATPALLWKEVRRSFPTASKPMES